MLCSIPRQTGQLRRMATRILTVCVVDPKADDYQGWDKVAEVSGVRFQIVHSAEEALRVARTHQVDLWVINTELPSLSGFELCSMLKAHNSRTTVYLVANLYSPTTEQMAWRARATLFGVKPTHWTWLESWAEQHAVRSPAGRGLQSPQHPPMNLQP